LGQQSLFEVQNAPPHPLDPSGPPASLPQPVVQAPVHGLPASSQSPRSSHICGCEPKQRRAPGLQLPLQVVPTQAWFGQGEGLPHWPSAPQISMSLASEQLVAPEVHMPTHALVTQVWPVQSTGEPHV
jgi:hypothetical protein